MDKTSLVNLLCDLKCENLEECENLEKLEEKCNIAYEALNCSPNEITKIICKFTANYKSEESCMKWRYIGLNFYLLDLLNKELKKSDLEILSVQQSKSVKICLRHIVSVGILINLQPNLPFYIKSENTDILLSYNILKFTTIALTYFIKQPDLRLLLVPDSLQAILVAIYQIGFCPLKKPDTTSTSKSTFVMTQQMYEEFLEDQENFKKMLNNLMETIHPRIFTKETMIIFQSNAPLWFKKAVSQTLTTIMRNENGIANISVALLDGTTNDSTKTWQILQVISKLILSCINFPDFKENICKQVIELLDKTTEDNLVFEQVFMHFTKSLYSVDQEMCKGLFIRKIISPVLYFTYKDHRFQDGDNITCQIKQTVRLVHGIFIEKGGNGQQLPIDILKPVVFVLFRFYCLTNNHDSLITTNNELRDILVGVLNRYQKDVFSIFDGFLFEINIQDILQFRNDIQLEVKEGNLVLSYSDHSVRYSVLENSEALLKLLKTKTVLFVNLFGYLLSCLTNKEKYFCKADDSLLNVEDQLMNESLERNITIFKLLSDLSNDKSIQKHITENPDDIIRYIQNVLDKTVETNTHKTNDEEFEGFQSVFTIIMILQDLVSNSTKSNLKKYQVLKPALLEISGECSNKELKVLVSSILDSLEGSKGKSTRYNIVEEKTKLEKAIEDVCDPLLPIRGHGLMTLTKLVEAKDINTLERKQYVLNIFQQNVKNDDSFIYLSAIGGLAALADIFPDTVLNILCEEYSDFSKNDNNEVRMKLGEVLVRVTKILGEMASKYKSLLLNTFLSGAKDEDHLIRASSLSNLGEVCRVLGYKLGTIVSEVLVCVHAIITTDSSVEARRAAVTVVRQLFIGLDNGTLVFLKDDILPIYRTLKQIYNNDKDDVMKLQAQLALEELNENMKNFVFPQQQLHMEKKIVMLN